ncbi:MAG: hypothetical protein ACJAT7_001640 [Psychromonas sp.]|jgi:hypothetical protein
MKILDIVHNNIAAAYIQFGLTRYLSLFHQVCATNEYRLLI